MGAGRCGSVHADFLVALQIRGLLLKVCDLCRAGARRAWAGAGGAAAV